MADFSKNRNKVSSVVKILMLYRFLLENSFEDTKKPCKGITKNLIAEEFNKCNIVINKPTLNRYFNILQKNGIEIEVQAKSVLGSKKQQNYYSLKSQKPCLSFSERQLELLEKIKQDLILFKKDPDFIRKTICLFYKIALNTSDMITRQNLVNFGYYSSINWVLLQELEFHTKKKNIILIEYIVNNKNIRSKKDIEILAESLVVLNSSNRIYLKGIIKDTNKFSCLPIDKIFLIKKVTEYNALKKDALKKDDPKKSGLLHFKAEIKKVRYKVALNVFEEIGKDDKEFVIETSDNMVLIERQNDDDFYLVQRLLSFCPYLYYISDFDLKQKVLEKLKSLKEVY